ncbi:MAG: DUF1573 domain-containing protein [Chryseolinea sp.]
MRILITIVGLIFFTSVQAQLAKPVQFREETFDFGMVVEENGSVLHEFLFTNNSSRPVKIINVQAACGCTTPNWSKDAVAPGKTGFIQASYNPKGRPGYFNKSLTVTTDYDGSPIILQIKGQVRVPGELIANSDFETSNGNWKLKSGSFNLGKIYMKDEFTSRDFPVMNAGTSTVTYLGKFIGPAYIKIEVTPKTLQPGEKGHIKVSYNGKLKGKYGFQSDNVELLTDDVENPTKSFSVYATMEDNFKDLKPEDIARAPQLKLQGTSFDLGRIQPNRTTVREVSFLNTGKKELDIRSLQGNCTCITASATKTSIKPGEAASIKVEFNPMDRKGTQQKSVTVYSNDPQNPVQRVTFAAYIED